MIEDDPDTPARPRHMAPRARRDWLVRGAGRDGGQGDAGRGSIEPPDRRTDSARSPSDRPARDNSGPADGARGGKGTPDRGVGDADGGSRTGRIGSADERGRGVGDGANGGGSGGDGGSDGEPTDRRRSIPGWVVPTLLGVAGAAAVVGAVLLNRDDPASPLDVAAGPTTPVLSARRAPEVLAAPIADRRLAADLEAWVAQSRPGACLVVEAGDDTLFAHNPTAPLAGASTQKLLTATALLLAYGPDHRLETVVGATAPVSDGIVPGDLFLVGGGDPLLATPAYGAGLNRNRGGYLTVDPVAIVDAIAAAGVTRIEGSVVGDDSRYDAERYHPVWPGRFRAQSVVGPVSALNVNDGFGFYFNDGMGAGAGATLDPATNAAAVITQLLRQRGIAVAGEARAGQAPGSLTSVATIPSATVREIVAEMLTDSDNDTAEMALKEVGVAENGAGTWQGGAAAATALLTEAGVGMDGVSIVDGSGLSDTNRVTCQLLVDLLTLPETGPVLVDGLAVAGETGTLAGRWEGTAVEGRLRAKTGTLNNVTSLSGRVSPVQGGTLTFSYVLNVAAPQAIETADVDRQNGLADILVNYPRGVDVTALQPAPPAAG
ncbi:MAG: D-alanyl-D-alanine carboxypeptidase/D-alanyl-D-alanine endopeptidase [Acidimicrobiales bacterium]